MSVRISIHNLTRVLAVLVLIAPVGACSVRNYAANRAADALAGSGGTFASDNDPELIRAAAPFSLKLMDSVLDEQPRHAALLTAASRSYTQFAYAYVQLDGEELEDQDIAQARAKFARARVLYVRARDYGLRSLEVAHPGIGDKLHKDTSAALADTQPQDVPSLYWTAASWGALISVSKGDPKTIAEVPLMQALIDRALVLDEAFDAGAIHTFLISYEPLRQGVKGDAAARAEQHFRAGRPALRRHASCPVRRAGRGGGVAQAGSRAVQAPARASARRGCGRPSAVPAGQPDHAAAGTLAAFANRRTDCRMTKE